MIVERCPSHDRSRIALSFQHLHIQTKQMFVLNGVNQVIRRLSCNNIDLFVWWNERTEKKSLYRIHIWCLFDLNKIPRIESQNPFSHWHWRSMHFGFSTRWDNRWLYFRMCAISIATKLDIYQSQTVRLFCTQQCETVCISILVSQKQSSK